MENIIARILLKDSLKVGVGGWGLSSFGFSLWEQMTYKFTSIEADGVRWKRKGGEKGKCRTPPL